MESLSGRFIDPLYVVLCAISHRSYNFKNVKNTHGGVLLSVKLHALVKVTLLHGCFSRFLNCAHATKSRNASHVTYTSTSFMSANSWLNSKFLDKNFHNQMFPVTSIYDTSLIMTLWYTLYNLKKVKNTHWWVILLVKLQAEVFAMTQIWNVFQAAGSQNRCFPVNTTKFLRTPILQNIRERLFLTLQELCN